MKIGDLVQSTKDSAIGIISELGNRFWNGAQWTFAHVQVSYPCDGKITWEMPDCLELINESR